MPPLARRPLRQNVLVNGAPRHFHVACARDCGWTGTRTADQADDLPFGRRCPRCNATVKAVRP